MDTSGPFKLTARMVREAGLLPEDVGAWCVFVDGCYHVFSSECQAIRAYEKLLQGIVVR